MLNKYFCSVFNTTSVGVRIIAKDINTSVSEVGQQDATIEPFEYNNVSVNNINVNLFVFDQQNHVHDNMINSNYTMPILEINFEDVNTINNLKNCKRSVTDYIYPKISKETKKEIINTLA